MPSPLRSLVTARIPAALGATALLTGHQFGEAGVSLVVGGTIQHAVDGGSPLQLAFWLAVLGLDFAVLSLCFRFGARAAAAVTAGLEHDIRILVVTGALSSRRRTGSTPGAAEQVAIATSDARRVAAAVRTTISVVVAAVTLVAVAGVLARISLLLAVLVVAAAAGVVVLLVVAGRPLERRSDAEQREKARTAALATDFARGLRVLVGFGAGQAAADRYRVQSRRTVDHTLRAAALEGGLTGLTALVVGLYLALVALVAGRMALAGELSIGELVAALGLAQFVLGPLQTLGRLGAALARGRASAARVSNTVGAEESAGTQASALPTRSGPASPVRTTPTVRKRTSRPAGSRPASADLILDEITSGPLRDLTLTIPAGAVFGLVVPDADEAHALVRLLAADAEVVAGSATCAALSATGPDPAPWRRHVLVLPHEAALFGSRIRHVLGDAASGSAVGTAVGPSAAPGTATGPSADVGTNTDLLAATVLSDLVRRDAPIGADGRSLSGGERQRLALARALASDAPVLVLYDPTTALDSATEAVVAAGIRRIRGGRTTVLVTTSPALLRVCDRVAVISAGRLASLGDHAHLAETEPAYREAVLT
jgi:putative ABC transport system ATP-binding protein